jgi:uncharacterized protein
MTVTTGPLGFEHAEAMWRINEEGLPGLGKVSVEEMEALLGKSCYALGAFRGGSLAGFVLCLHPNAAYGSLNYAWFNKHYSHFLYVDRIAVGAEERNSGIGTILYSAVSKQANEEGVPIAAEVNLEPPNPGSMRFHQRHGFTQVGTLEHPTYAVAMMMKG